MQMTYLLSRAAVSCNPPFGAAVPDRCTARLATLGQYRGTGRRGNSVGSSPRLPPGTFAVGGGAVAGLRFRLEGARDNFAHAGPGAGDESSRPGTSGGRESA